MLARQILITSRSLEGEERGEIVKSVARVKLLHGELSGGAPGFHPAIAIHQLPDGD